MAEKLRRRQRFEIFQFKIIKKNILFESEIFFKKNQKNPKPNNQTNENKQKQNKLNQD